MNTIKKVDHELEVQDISLGLVIDKLDNISIRPGDITVNYLLVIFTLILSPLYVALPELFECLEFNFWQRIIYVYGVTFIAFELIIRTRRGILIIQRIVELIKSTKISK